MCSHIYINTHKPQSWQISEFPSQATNCMISKHSCELRWCSSFTANQCTVCSVFFFVARDKKKIFRWKEVIEKQMKLRSKSNDKFAAVLMYNQLLSRRLNKNLLSPQIIWSFTTDSKFYINLIQTLFILCTYIYQNLTLLFICPNLKVAVTPGLQSVISVCAAVTHWHLHQPDVHSAIQLASTAPPCSRGVAQR